MFPRSTCQVDGWFRSNLKQVIGKLLGRSSGRTRFGDCEWERDQTILRVAKME